MYSDILISFKRPQFFIYTVPTLFHPDNVGLAVSYFHFAALYQSKEVAK